jgi:hypothetical protein
MGEHGREQAMTEGTKTPTPKVAAAGVGGAMALVLVAIGNAVGLDLPPELASAIVLVLSVGAGYLKR